MAGGRPTKYDPAYCEQIVKFCADGFSITAFAGSIGVCRDTITHWGNEHPEFSASVKAAKAAWALWYERQGQRVAQNGGGPGTATMIIFSLKNAAPDDYRESQSLNIDGKVTHDAGSGFEEFTKALDLVARSRASGADGSGEVDQ